MLLPSWQFSYFPVFVFCDYLRFSAAVIFFDFLLRLFICLRYQFSHQIHEEKNACQTHKKNNHPSRYVPEFLTDESSHDFFVIGNEYDQNHHLLHRLQIPAHFF